MNSVLIMSLIASLLGGGMAFSGNPMTLNLSTEIEDKIEAILTAHPDLEIEIEKEVNGQRVKVEFENEDGVIEKKVEIRNEDVGENEDRVEFRLENEDENEVEIEFEDDDEDNDRHGNSGRR